MSLSQILSPRRLMILLHRWTGIVAGVLFIPWFISGIVFTYRDMPRFSNEERLAHLAPIDTAALRTDPIEAAHSLKIKPNRLRIATYYDGRPVYRFQGSAAVYPDTGEPVPGRDERQALELVRQFEPEHARAVTYAALMDDIDLWTAGNAGRGRDSQMPLHKIAVNDADDTHYYISAKSGEPVMKTDRWSRLWGFMGPVLHQWYFTSLRRNDPLWDKLVAWGSATGMVICLSGLIAGIWQFSMTGRFKKRGRPVHSPYAGWLLWHHYAGLIFGLVSFTWIFSGGLAYSFYRGPSIDPSAEQRAITSGGPLRVDMVRLEKLRAGLDVISKSFKPKEAEVLQFRGKLYLLANDGPGDRTLIGATDRDPSYKPPDYRMVWLDEPERGTFMKFDDAVMADIAREAMPNVEIVESAWINEYDNYYRSRTKSQPLPVLRVRYADEQKTWLYLDPHRGSIALVSRQHNRVRRWLYNGLHKFDFPFVYERRRLWQVCIVVMSIGGLLLSSTTLLPAYRRLRRHAARAVRASGRKTAAATGLEQV
jgi:hypothetical protein